ncbi:uncharacterized protein LOC121385943 [Gigantopelta aegis]|uniref:uncharacterized protein LOC121385943 n=1 Tax=Gigantopelta aegis TaxID=1735272 RepID=UPI001B88D1B3|nr:uncharacterized protein LOC121385943 [Gigantopelta aegis]
MTMTLVWLFCAFALMVGGILGFDHTDWRFVTTSYKGEKVNGVVGLNRRSMLMIPDPVDKASKCNRRTINQHDFEKRLVAMKDPSNTGIGGEATREEGDSMHTRRRPWTVGGECPSDTTRRN